MRVVIEHEVLAGIGLKLEAMLPHPDHKQLCKAPQCPLSFLCSSPLSLPGWVIDVCLQHVCHLFRVCPYAALYAVAV